MRNENAEYAERTEHAEQSIECLLLSVPLFPCVPYSRSLLLLYAYLPLAIVRRLRGSRVLPAYPGLYLIFSNRRAFPYSNFLCTFGSAKRRMASIMRMPQHSFTFVSTS